MRKVKDAKGVPMKTMLETHNYSAHRGGVFGRTSGEWENCLCDGEREKKIRLRGR